MIDFEETLAALVACADDQCANCPRGDEAECYAGIGVKMVEVPQELLADAIALLRAQEPRVMTLEEACGAEECWIDRAWLGGDSLTAAKIRHNGLKQYDIESGELETLRSYIMRSDQYGVNWRCWSARPTKEERERESWK